MYLSIFGRTAGGLALTALIAAQGLEWTNVDTALSSAEVVGWGLLAAVIGGLIAVGWSFVGTPATTPVGKALRSAVQALLGLPIAGVVIDNVSDLVELGDLVVPTIAATVLAFLVSYLSNKTPAPAAPEGSKATAADFLGTS